MTRSRPLTLLAAAAVSSVIALVLAGLAVVGAGCGSTQSASAVSAVPLASASGTRSLEQQFVGVVKAVSPSVVQIQSGESLGSGVVFDARGDVVTNAHVVGNATRSIVTLASGDSHPASVVGTDRGQDLALIRFTGGRPRPATFADSSKLQVGDIALAIGNPLGLRSSVTRASSRRCAGASPRATASRSRRSSKRAPRSTPVTPAARLWTSPVE